MQYLLKLFLWPQSKSFQDCGTREVDSLLETASGELQGLGIKKKNCFTVCKTGSLKTNAIDTMVVTPVHKDKYSLTQKC